MYGLNDAQLNLIQNGLKEMLKGRPSAFTAYSLYCWLRMKESARSAELPENSADGVSQYTSGRGWFRSATGTLISHREVSSYLMRTYPNPLNQESDGSYVARINLGGAEPVVYAPLSSDINAYIAGIRESLNRSKEIPDGSPGGVNDAV